MDSSIEKKIKKIKNYFLFGMAEQKLYTAKEAIAITGDSPWPKFTYFSDSECLEGGEGIAVVVR